MGIDTDIRAIYADGTTTRAEKLAARDALIVKPGLGPTLPWKFTDGDVTVAVTRVAAHRDINNRLAWDVEYKATKAGQLVAVSMPHRIINPPALIPDAAGAVVRDVVDSDGLKTGEKHFREDPIAALRQAILDTVRALAK